MRLGLIVLQVDETVEDDFRRYFPPDDATLHVSRIPSGADLTPETIATMEAELPRAAALLPQAVPYDSVGYACTSGTTLIGAARIHHLVAGAVPAKAVTDPLTATLAAFAHLGIARIGLVSPYIESVSAPIVDAFETAGLEVRASRSFGEQVEAKVARIAPAATRQAAREIGADSAIDAVFLSCTNLRTREVIDELEETLGKPVLSSNLALAWHMAQLAGADLGPGAPGRYLKH